MINKQLLSPESIVVVGASNNTQKPGGKILKNLIDNKFRGHLYAVNPKDNSVQGVQTFSSLENLPMIDLAIIAVNAKYCPDIVEFLAKEKNARAFIIISAGFSEESDEGTKLEERMVKTVNETGGCLIGPNGIGVLTQTYAGVFTTPIPKFDPMGCDFVSGSGATTVFIIESGIPKGLHFASIFSVGNSPQCGVEEVLEYWDDSYVHGESSPVKLLYIENISNPDKLLHHASSLIRKGCKIAAIKAGSTEAGSRAAASHTGALTSSDSAVEALFRKAGIVRCYGREELTTVACIFMCRPMQGKNIAIITHAGGPAVMLTDALELGGLNIPQLPDSPKKEELKEKLLSGSSVENPIDFLATGNALHLEATIDACENDFDEIDAMAVIFGSPGLFSVKDVYSILDKKMKTCKKPIYPILPSVINVKEDLAYFLSHGNVNFPDEVVLGKALTKVVNTPDPSTEQIIKEGVDIARIRSIIDNCNDGYIAHKEIEQLLKAASIPIAKEIVANTSDKALAGAAEIGFPVVMKVIGIIHKTDVGGVVLNVNSKEQVLHEFKRLMAIPDVTSILIAEQLQGLELFVGAKYEPGFGHVILCGMGGIFIEVLKDFSSALAPLNYNEAISMIRDLKSYKIIKGYRGKEGINEHKFAEIIVRLSTLLRFATEIKEIDINPLIGACDNIYAADVRIRVEHWKK